MDRDTLLTRLSGYPFYHRIDLGDGIVTPGLPPGPKQQLVLRMIARSDLRGKRAIDIGCANGLFALALEKQGSSEVIAVDHTRRNIESLNELILPRLGSGVKAVHANLLEMTAEAFGRFDMVVFAGVLYHLRFPFSALKVVRDLTAPGGQMILETGIFEDFNGRAALYCPSPADTPFKGRFANSCTYFNQRALLETLEYFGFSVRERKVVCAPLRRVAKKLAGRLVHSYFPASNIVLRCERDPSLENPKLVEFYEARTA